MTWLVLAKDNFLEKNLIGIYQYQHVLQMDPVGTAVTLVMRWGISMTNHNRMAYISLAIQKTMCLVEDNKNGWEKNRKKCNSLLNRIIPRILIGCCE